VFLKELVIVDFYVSDTGFVFSLDELTLLFKPFTQKVQKVQAQEGTGLGLSISLQLINLMGGEISVTSRGYTVTYSKKNVPTYSRENLKLKNNTSLSSSGTTFSFNIGVGKFYYYSHQVLWENNLSKV